MSVLSLRKQSTEVISLDQLLKQLSDISWKNSEDNIGEVGIKAETTTTSTTPKITVAPFFTQTTATPSFLNTILSTLQSIGTTSKPSRNKLTTLSPVRFSSTYRAPYLSPPSKATTPTPITTTSTTVRSITTAPRTTTAIPPTTTPSAVDSTPPTPFTSKPAVLSGNEHFSTVFPYFNPDELPLLSILSTERPRRTNALENSTTKKKIPTSQGSKKLQSETSKIEEVTESLEELLKKPIDSIKPKKKLTEQQKKDLETVRQLEKEQAAILKQLSFLTNLNLNGNSGGSSDDLAKKIVNLGKERDSRKIKSSTTSRSTTKPTTSAPPKPSEPPRTKDKAEIDAEATRMKQIENLIKLLNMNGVTPSPNKASTYGTSNDAILASLLKERGIGPTTPKQLAEQIEQLGFFTEALEVTTKPTRKPKSTTQPTRGPLINWLLSAFAPPSTKAPARKSKPKRPRTTTEADLDLLTNEATESTPVATTSPPKKKSVSQNDIQKLIRQLETIQKDPSAAKNFDFATFKNLQNLNSENVQVFMPGSSGVSQRETTKTITRSVTPRSRSTSTIDPLREAHTSKELNRAVRTSTYSPTPVSNSLFDDVDDIVTTQKGRVTLPPVKLRPVNGVSDDAGSVVRGRLLTAAVNVTRALSGFLGSALQGAVRNLARALSGGSLRNVVSSSIPQNSQANTDDDSSTDQYYDDYAE
ncbi:hypothetical protein HHI36_010423 [Cryptolaemus montrouzieri]|uniref:Uncharacterized protein n=1 Tax=Cryptolaemus montrouzieri TaxID=559131 RepID=A0ABD2MIN5_9CUCU